MATKRITRKWASAADFNGKSYPKQSVTLFLFELNMRAEGSNDGTRIFQGGTR